MRLRKYLLISLLLSVGFGTQAMEPDDPLLFMFKLDRLEVAPAQAGNPVVSEGFLWAGHDLNKLWIKFESEYHEGTLEELETQILYSRALYPYWDLQLGWRRDHRPRNATRDWLAVGLQGLAPYWWEVDAALFLGESGRTAARLNLEYELLLTQRLALIPELEMNLYGKDDAARGIGSGLSDLALDLRLSYEIRREIAPYIGVHWSRKYGSTARYARSAGGEVQDTQWLLGVRIWF